MRTAYLFNLVIFIQESFAQRLNKKSVEKTSKSVFEETTLTGLKFRSIGPAQTSGRVSDFAINPNNFKEYYVAAASGGCGKRSMQGPHIFLFLMRRAVIRLVVSLWIQTMLM